MRINQKQLRLTKCIWLRAFGTPPKSSLTAGLQIHSERYVKCAAKKLKGGKPWKN